MSLTENFPDFSGYHYPTPVFITNALPYAEPIEHGHSKQAPAGMVAVTAAEVAAGVNTEILSRGGVI